MVSNKMKNNKGFTMIELLVTVVILGILSTIAIGSVQRILDNSKDEYYSSQEENIILAAQTYYQNNRKELPKAIGQEKEIKLSKLQSTKYIETIKDHNDGQCKMDDSYVTVIKYNKTDYKYNIYLDCGEAYKTPDPSAKISPTIEVITAVDSGNVDGVKGNEAKIKIKGSEDGTKKLMSYSYVIYKADADKNANLSSITAKDYKEVKNSGSITARGKSKEIPLNLDGYVPGVLKIQATVINEDGIKVTKTVGPINYADRTAPLCNNLVIQQQASEWTQGPTTVTVICQDDEKGMGCARPYYTQIFTAEGETQDITIKDKAGNSQGCPVKTMIDKTEPTLKIKLSKSDGTLIEELVASPSTATTQNKIYGWFNENYKNGINITYEVSDSSGLKNISVARNQKGLTATATNVNTLGTPTVTDLAKTKSTSGTIANLTSPADEGFNKFQIILTDVAGKQSIVNMTIPYDATKPTKPTLTRTPSSTSCTDGTISVTMSSTETMSGLNKWQYNYTSSTSWKNMDDSVGKSPYTTVYSAKRNEDTGLRVCDIAGNCSEKSTTRIHIGCCSKENPTACGKLYTCRSAAPDHYENALTELHNTASFSSPQCIYMNSGTLLYKIGESGQFYYVYVADGQAWGSGNRYYDTGRYGYIKKGCTSSTKPSSSYWCPSSNRVG